MTDEARAGSGRRRLAAALLGLVAALIASEGLLRLTGFGWYAPRRDHYEMISVPAGATESVFRFLPGGLSWHEWDGDPYGTLPPGARMEYPHEGRADVRGEPEAAIAREGVPRVLFVGDSFTFGEGVPADETFVARTQAALERDGQAVQALNAGVPGYGTREIRLRLPMLLDRFAPEAVVVVFTPNDAIDVSAAHARGEDLLRYVPRPHVSRVVALLERAWSARERARDTEGWYLAHYVGEDRAAWDVARSDLGRIRDLATERGVRLGVAYFPLLHRLEDGPLDAIRDEVAAFCAGASIPFLDLGPGFAGIDESSLWVHPVDHHPNARAHALAAEALVPFVRGLTPTR